MQEKTASKIVPITSITARAMDEVLKWTSITRNLPFAGDNRTACIVSNAILHYVQV